jgi:hypothetical protein
MCRALFLAIFIAAAAAAASGQTDSRTTTYKGPVRIPLPCRGPHLAVRHVTEDTAMGGWNSIDYAFKNISLNACTLKGYSRYELLSKTGKLQPRGRAINSEQLPGDETRRRPQLVTIHPGEETGFRVYYNSGGAGYVGKPCPVSRRVRIVAPGTTRAFVLKENITSCRTVQVSAVRNGPPRD